MRGEHLAKKYEDEHKAGSSPHARGARQPIEKTTSTAGIIPACAGSTELRPITRYFFRDHPRMRGEHLMSLRSVWAMHGSSPHARGAPGSVTPCKFDNGIIPACAGSTLAVAYTSLRIGDHPRMRGEHGNISRVVRSRAGSSPHARGALHDLHYGLVILGIIPACAGSTTCSF